MNNCKFNFDKFLCTGNYRWKRADKKFKASSHTSDASRELLKKINSEHSHAPIEIRALQQKNRCPRV